jgi:hypothetical protein
MPIKAPQLIASGLFNCISPSHINSLHTVTYGGTIDGIEDKAHEQYRQPLYTVLFYKDL